MQTILVKDKIEGVERAKEFLYEKVDGETLLFLSGGQSPKVLYERLASEKTLHPGAAAMIDERYGLPMHKDSNERMLIDTGLLGYFKEKHISWYPILEKDLSREEAAEKYEQTIYKLFTEFHKSVALVSIGIDGHTAGIPAYISNLKNQISKIYNTYKFVTNYNDKSGKYGERITVTFEGLAKIDYLLLWVFGKEKREALKKMFEAGNEEDIPTRFYIRKEILKKVVLITDLEI